MTHDGLFDVNPANAAPGRLQIVEAPVSGANQSETPRRLADKIAGLPAPEAVTQEQLVKRATKSLPNLVLGPLICVFGQDVERLVQLLNAFVAAGVGKAVDTLVTAEDLTPNLIIEFGRTIMAAAFIAIGTIQNEDLGQPLAGGVVAKYVADYILDFVTPTIYSVVAGCQGISAKVSEAFPGGAPYGCDPQRQKLMPIAIWAATAIKFSIVGLGAKLGPRLGPYLVLLNGAITGANMLFSALTDQIMVSTEDKECFTGAIGAIGVLFFVGLTTIGFLCQVAVRNQRRNPPNATDAVPIYIRALKATAGAMFPLRLLNELLHKTAGLNMKAKDAWEAVKRETGIEGPVEMAARTMIGKVLSVACVPPKIVEAIGKKAMPEQCLLFMRTVGSGDFDMDKLQNFFVTVMGPTFDYPTLVEEEIMKGSVPALAVPLATALGISIVQCEVLVLRYLYLISSPVERSAEDLKEMTVEIKFESNDIPQAIVGTLTAKPHCKKAELFVHLILGLTLVALIVIRCLEVSLPLEAWWGVLSGTIFFTLMALVIVLCNTKGRLARTAVGVALLCSAAACGLLLAAAIYDKFPLVVTDLLFVVFLAIGGAGFAAFLLFMAQIFWKRHRHNAQVLLFEKQERIAVMSNGKIKIKASKPGEMPKFRVPLALAYFLVVGGVSFLGRGMVMEGANDGVVDREALSMISIFWVLICLGGFAVMVRLDGKASRAVEYVGAIMKLNSMTMVVFPQDFKVKPALDGLRALVKSVPRTGFDFEALKEIAEGVPGIETSVFDGPIAMIRQKLRRPVVSTLRRAIGAKKEEAIDLYEKIPLGVLQKAILEGPAALLDEVKTIEKKVPELFDAMNRVLLRKMHKIIATPLRFVFRVPRIQAMTFAQLLDLEDFKAFTKGDFTPLLDIDDLIEKGSGKAKAKEVAAVASGDSDEFRLVAKRVGDTSFTSVVPETLAPASFFTTCAGAKKEVADTCVDLVISLRSKMKVPIDAYVASILAECGLEPKVALTLVPLINFNSLVGVLKGVLQGKPIAVDLDSIKTMFELAHPDGIEGVDIIDWDTIASAFAALNFMNAKRLGVPMPEEAESAEVEDGMILNLPKIEWPISVPRMSGNPIEYIIEKAPVVIQAAPIFAQELPAKMPGYLQMALKKAAVTIKTACEAIVHKKIAMKLKKVANIPMAQTMQLLKVVEIKEMPDLASGSMDLSILKVRAIRAGFEIDWEEIRRGMVVLLKKSLVGAISNSMGFKKRLKDSLAMAVDLIEGEQLQLLMEGDFSTICDLDGLLKMAAEKKVTLEFPPEFKRLAMKFLDKGVAMALVQVLKINRKMAATLVECMDFEQMVAIAKDPIGNLQVPVLKDLADKYRDKAGEKKAADLGEIDWDQLVMRLRDTAESKIVTILESKTGTPKSVLECVLACLSLEEVKSVLKGDLRLFLSIATLRERARVLQISVDWFTVEACVAKFSQQMLAEGLSRALSIRRQQCDLLVGLLTPMDCRMMLAGGVSSICMLSLASMKQKATRGPQIDWKHVLEKLSKVFIPQVTGLLLMGLRAAHLDLDERLVEVIVACMDPFFMQEILQAATPKGMKTGAAMLANIKMRARTIVDQLQKAGPESLRPSKGQESEVMVEKVHELFLAVVLQPLDTALTFLLTVPKGTLLALLPWLDVDDYLVPLFNGHLKVLFPRTAGGLWSGLPEFAADSGADRAAPQAGLYLDRSLDRGEETASAEERLKEVIAPLRAGCLAVQQRLAAFAIAGIMETRLAQNAVDAGEKIPEVDPFRSLDAAGRIAERLSDQDLEGLVLEGKLGCLHAVGELAEDAEELRRKPTLADWYTAVRGVLKSSGDDVACAHVFAGVVLSGIMRIPTPVVRDCISKLDTGGAMRLAAGDFSILMSFEGVKKFEAPLAVSRSLALATNEEEAPPSLMQMKARTTRMPSPWPRRIGLLLVVGAAACVAVFFVLWSSWCGAR